MFRKDKKYVSLNLLKWDKGNNKKKGTSGD